MSFGVGAARSDCRWWIAVGVRVMAALRGRSLDLRGAAFVPPVGVDWVVVVEDGEAVDEEDAVVFDVVS